MKLKLSLATICFIVSGLVESTKNYEIIISNSSFSSDLVKSVREIIETGSTKFQGAFCFISSQGNHKSRVGDFKNELLLSLFIRSNVVLSHEHPAFSPQNKQKRGAILVVESYEEIFKIIQMISAKAYHTNGFFIVVSVNGIIRNIKEIFSILWQKKFYNVVAVYETEAHEILLETFFPFTTGNCNNTKPFIINEYSNGEFTNGKEKIYPDKMKNLFNCTIRVATSKDAPPTIFLRKLEGELFELSGGDIDIIRALSESLKFNINFTYFDKEGEFYANGTATGPLKALLDGTAELSICDWWLKTNRLKFFDSTTDYMSESAVFIVPPGRDFTTFEKLMFPYSAWVWFMTSFCFFTGFLVVFIIKFRFKKYQTFVFGTGVRNPYLNIILVSTGGSQKTLPKRNFARFILMMFLIQTIVLRTVYQASYYNLLQSDKHRNELQSIDEMIEGDFTFYIFLGLADVFQGNEAINKKYDKLIY